MKLKNDELKKLLSSLNPRQLRYDVLDVGTIWDLDLIIPEDKYYIISIDYKDNSRFIVKSVPNDILDALVNEEIANKEEETHQIEKESRKKKIISTLLRSISKCLTGTVTDDPYVEVQEGDTVELLLVSEVLEKYWDSVVKLNKYPKGGRCDLVLDTGEIISLENI